MRKELDVRFVSLLIDYVAVDLGVGFDVAEDFSMHTDKDGLVKGYVNPSINKVVFINFNACREVRDIALRTDRYTVEDAQNLMLLDLADTIAHEARHIWQLQHGLCMDNNTDYNARWHEVDARQYADTVTTRVLDKYLAMEDSALEGYRSYKVIPKSRAKEMYEKAMKKGITFFKKDSINPNKKEEKKMKTKTNSQKRYENKVTLLNQFTKEALEEIAVIQKVDLPKKVTKLEMIDLLHRKVLLLPFIGGIKVVSFDDGASFHLIDKNAEVTGILNDTHVNVAVEDKSNCATTVLDAKKTYVIRKFQDIFNLFILENKKSNQKLMKDAKKGDVYVPDMSILGRYFDAVVITSEFVKETRNVPEYFAARESAVYLKNDRKRAVSIEEIDNAEALKEKAKRAVMHEKGVKTNDAADTINISIDSIEYDDLGRLTLKTPKDPKELMAYFTPVGGSQFADDFCTWSSYTHPKSGEVKPFRYFSNFGSIDLTVGNADDAEKTIIANRIGYMYTMGVYVDIVHPVKGYRVKGLFVPITRSASQGRQGGMWLVKVADDHITDSRAIRTEADRMKVLMAEGMEFYGKTLEKNKVDNWITLGFSTSKALFSREEMAAKIAKWNVKVISDCDVTTDETFQSLETRIVTAMEIVNGRNTKVEKVEHTMKLHKNEAFTRTPHDGQSHVALNIMAEMALKERLISLSEYLQLMTVFEECGRSLKNMREKVLGSLKLSRIMFSIPAVYQVRTNLIKGTFVLADIKEWAKGTEFEDCDIVVGDSSIKYPIKEEGNNKLTLTKEQMFRYLRTCAHSKAPKAGRLSQQVIQGMEVPAETVVSWSEKAVKKIISVTKSPLAAINYLGSYYDVDDEGMDLVDVAEENDTMTKLQRTLEENNSMLYTRYAQNKLFTMIRKQLSDMRFGKVPFEMSYQFVVTDPRTLFNSLGVCNNELQSGENYYNNTATEYGAIRHPYIFKSSADVITTVEDNELWFMKNTIVLNAFDTTLQRLSGADTDGDKFGISDNKEFVEALRPNTMLPFLYTAKASGKSEPYTHAVERTMYMRGMSISRVGQFTNYALVLRDIQQCANKPKIVGITVDSEGKAIENLDQHLTNLQMIIDQVIGKEIDKEKTGEDVLIMDCFKSLKVRPMWHKDKDVAFMTEEQKALLNETKIYESDSALGKNYRRISAFILGDDKSNDETMNNKRATSIVDEKLAAIGYDPLSEWAPYVNMKNVEKMYEQIKSWVREYNKSLAIIVQERAEYVKALGGSKDDNAKGDEVYKDDFEALFNKYTEKFNEYRYYASDRDIAYCVYMATDDIISKRKGSKLQGASCPWCTCYEAMRDLNILAGSRGVYVRLNVPEGVDSVIVNNIGDVLAECDDEMTVLRKMTKVRPGRYSIIRLENGKTFIKVPREVEGFVKERANFRERTLGPATDMPKVLISVYAYPEIGEKLTSEQFVERYKTFGILNTRNGCLAMALVDGAWKQIGKVNVAGKDKSNVSANAIKSALINTVVAVNEASHTDKSIMFEAVVVGAMDTKIAVSEQKQAMPEEAEDITITVLDAPDAEVTITIDDDANATDVAADYDDEFEEFNTSYTFTMDDESIAAAHAMLDAFNSDDEYVINLD